MLLSSPTASLKPTYPTSPLAPRVLTKQVAQGGASCSKQALALWELQGWSLLFWGSTSSRQRDTFRVKSKEKRRWSQTASSQEPALSQESVCQNLVYWGKCLSRDQGGNRGSRLRKGKKVIKTRSSHREPWSVRRTLEYVLPQGHGAGILDFHTSQLWVKATEQASGTEIPQVFLKLYSGEAVLKGLHTGNPLHGWSRRLSVAAKPADSEQKAGARDPMRSYGGPTVPAIGASGDTSSCSSGWSGTPEPERSHLAKSRW